MDAEAVTMTGGGGVASDVRRASTTGRILLALVALLVLTLLVAVAGDVGSRHAQILLSFITEVALWGTMTWHIVALSRTRSLPPQARRYWRILIVTGVAAMLSYASGIAPAAKATVDDAAFRGVVGGVFGAISGTALLLAGLTYRTDRETGAGHRRLWLDALVTMIAGLGALWFVQSNSLLAAGTSVSAVITNVIANALSIVAVLALLRPMASHVRPLSVRGGVLALFAIAGGIVIEILAPHTVGTEWLRLVLALRAVIGIAAIGAVWQERLPGRAATRPARRNRVYSRSPYVAVAGTYVLLGCALWFGHAGGQVWGMFTAAAAATAVVAYRQFLSFRDNAVLVDELRSAAEAASALTEQLHTHAYFDELTRLPNRAHFSERLEQLLGPATDPRAPVGVMLLDLDDFKLVNDRAGHAVGDEVLVQAGGRLTAAVRDDGFVVRLGGDEFAILVAGATEATVAELARRVVASFEAPFELTAGDALVGVSIGTAIGTAGEDCGETLLRNADLAMYGAKSAGKSRVAAFDPSMLVEVRAKHETREALTRAVGRREIVVYYQPIVSSRGQQVVAVEALARWDRPGHGVLAPSDFLPLAEQIGLVSAIDELVLREACRLLREWNDANAVPLGVHVNVSAHTMAQPRFVQIVRDTIAETGIPARLLTLELTETALMSQPAAIIVAMRALRATGVRVAIDDFGTGYSSLAYLRDLPLDVVKMDRSFVERIAHSAVDREVVRMIVELADTLGLTTVAEGIETAEQAAYLVGIGCLGMQGHLFSPAVPAHALAEAVCRSAAQFPRQHMDLANGTTERSRPA
ncbi:MAG: diguanylate cyclase [Frankiaceae bacterium]|nr:diguanylate cyclase [Frankiaceae bacterium]